MTARIYHLRPTPEREVVNLYEAAEFLQLDGLVQEAEHEFQTSLSIIGWGMACGYLCVCCLRLAQIGGLL